MKWLFSLLCFTTTAAFSQANKPLLEKLKTTQERLKGKSIYNIPNPGLELTQKGKKPSLNVGENKPPLAFVVPERKGSDPGQIPNVIARLNSKPRVIRANEQIMVLALPQDNMPCIVPNMKLFKLMPGVTDKTIEENQKFFKLLEPKQKS